MKKLNKRGVEVITIIPEKWCERLLNFREEFKLTQVQSSKILHIPLWMQQNLEYQTMASIPIKTAKRIKHGIENYTIKANKAKSLDR